jgi:hypothetical protein
MYSQWLWGTYKWINLEGYLFSSVQCTKYNIYSPFYRMRLCYWDCTFDDVITCNVIACQSCNTHSCPVRHRYGQACNKKTMRKMKVVWRESESWTWCCRRVLVPPASNPSCGRRKHSTTKPCAQNRLWLLTTPLYTANGIISSITSTPPQPPNKLSTCRTPEYLYV